MRTRKKVRLGTRRGSCRSDCERTNTKQVIIRLNKRTDADILETLAACGNVQGYIKALIRADVSAPTEDGNAR